MTVTVTNRSGKRAPVKQVQSLLEYCFPEFELNPQCELAVTFIDDEEMEQLHLEWMDEPGSTDVMSFPMDIPTGDEATILGDIVISPAFAATQAKKQGHSTEHEIYILAVHGFLHILGYDHATKKDETEMFTLQEELVAEWER